MSNITSAKAVVAAIDLAILGGDKATDVFRQYVGFPKAAPVAMEKAYDAILAYVAIEKGETNEKVKAQAVRRNGKIRQLMSECRKTCAKPYTKTKKGVLSPIAAKAKAKGADKRKDEPDEAPKVVGITNADALARVGSLANTFLPPAQRAAFSAAIALILDKVTQASKAKK